MHVIRKCPWLSAGHNTCFQYKTNCTPKSDIYLGLSENEWNHPQFKFTAIYEKSTNIA